MRHLTLAMVFLSAGCGSSDPAPLLPLPATGYQLNVGPFEVPSATNEPVYPGSVLGEVQLCRTLKLPNDEPAAVNFIEVAMNHGSHHLILFRSKTDFPDQVFPCWGTVNFEDWGFIMDVNRTGGADWQLADGQAFVLDPHQQIMVQVHFVNASTVQAPLGGQATINLHTEPMEKVVHPLHGVFTVNTAIDIPPGGTYTTPTRHCTFSSTAQVVAMTGHFHARGTDFNVHRFTNMKPKLGAPFYEDHGEIYDSTSWDAPPFKLFDPPMLLPGGTPVEAQGVDFKCSYQNNTDKEIGWGGHADTQEHCNLFFQYYKYEERTEDLRCSEGSGGW